MRKKTTTFHAEKEREHSHEIQYLKRVNVSSVYSSVKSEGQK